LASPADRSTEAGRSIYAGWLLLEAKFGYSIHCVFSASGVVGRKDSDVRTESETGGTATTMGLGDLGDLGNLDLGGLQQLLPNVDFPASKDEVLSDLQGNDAPREVVDQVRNSGKDTFNSADEVLQTVQGKL
jgi:hypothetical protein